MKASVEYRPQHLFRLEEQITADKYFYFQPGDRYEDVGIVIDYEESAGVDGDGEAYAAKQAFGTLVERAKRESLPAKEIARMPGVTCASFKSVCEHYYKDGMRNECGQTCKSNTLVYVGHYPLF